MENIRIQGARIHNLKNINLTIPKRQLVVITGISGSGKSSLAFVILFEVDKIIIYSTCPVKRIVGEVEVLDIIEMDKEKLWKITKKQAGITKKFYDQYYKGRETAVAYKLGEVIEYDEPQLLDDIGVKMAPQSYMYLPEKVAVC